MANEGEMHPSDLVASHVVVDQDPAVLVSALGDMGRVPNGLARTVIEGLLLCVGVRKKLGPSGRGANLRGAAVLVDLVRVAASRKVSPMPLLVVVVRFGAAHEGGGRRRDLAQGPGRVVWHGTGGIAEALGVCRLVRRARLDRCKDHADVVVVKGRGAGKGGDAATPEAPGEAADAQAGRAQPVPVGSSR